MPVRLLDTQTDLAATADSATFTVPTGNISDRTLVLYIDVTDEGNADNTLDVDVEWSFDGSAFFDADTPDSFVQWTATGTKYLAVSAIAPYYRLEYTIAGTTPAYDFTVQELSFSDRG